MKDKTNTVLGAPAKTATKLRNGILQRAHQRLYILCGRNFLRVVCEQVLTVPTEDCSDSNNTLTTAPAAFVKSSAANSYDNFVSEVLIWREGPRNSTELC